MSDPVTIGTSIITLSSVLKFIIDAWGDFVNADQKIRDIKNACTVTQWVVDHLRQQLDARDSSWEIPIDRSRPANRTRSLDASTSLENVLRDNVGQLRHDLGHLETELNALRGPDRPSTRFGSLVERGKVTWKRTHLANVHQKIVTTQTQLTFVLVALNS
jgi:hypothetical protein